MPFGTYGSEGVNVRFRFSTSYNNSFCVTNMNVESNYVIASATLIDWLKDISPVFQPMTRKTKKDHTLYVGFFELNLNLAVKELFSERLTHLH